MIAPEAYKSNNDIQVNLIWNALGNSVYSVIVNNTIDGNA